MSLDFSSAYLTSGANALRENAATTLSLWMYPRTLGASDLGRILFRAGSSSSNGVSLNMMANSIIQFGVDGGTKLDVRSAINAITLNAWQHVALSWDGSTTAANAKIYVNGAEVSYSAQINGSAPGGVTGQLLIGNRGDFTRGFDGLLAEIPIWDHQLSVEEIVSLSRGFTGARVSPEGMLFNAPLIRDVLDFKGNTLTNSGATVAAAHPRIYP